MTVVSKSKSTPIGPGTGAPPSRTSEQRSYYSQPTTPSGTPRRTTVPAQTTPSKTYVVAGKEVSKEVFEAAVAKQKAEQEKRIGVTQSVQAPKPITVSEQMKQVSQQDLQGNKLQQTLTAPLTYDTGYEYRTGYMGEGIVVPKKEKKEYKLSFIDKIASKTPFRAGVEIEREYEAVSEFEREQAIYNETKRRFEIKFETKQDLKEIENKLSTMSISISKLQEEYPNYEIKEVEGGVSIQRKAFGEGFYYQEPKWGVYEYGYKKTGGGLKGGIFVASLVGYKITKEFVKYAPIGFGTGTIVKLGWGAEGLATLGKVEKGFVGLSLTAGTYSAIKYPRESLMLAPEIVGGALGYSAGRGASTKALSELYKTEILFQPKSIRTKSFQTEGVDVYFGKARTTEIQTLKYPSLGEVLPKKIKGETSLGGRYFSQVYKPESGVLEAGGYKRLKVETDVYYGQGKGEGFVRSDVLVKGNELATFKGQSLGSFALESKKVTTPFYTQQFFKGSEYLREPKLGGKLYSSVSRAEGYYRIGIRGEKSRLPSSYSISQSFIPKGKSITPQELFGAKPPRYDIGETVELYHGTTALRAESIIRLGFYKGDVSFTENIEFAKSFANRAVIKEMQGGKSITTAKDIALGKSLKTPEPDIIKIQIPKKEFEFYKARTKSNFYEEVVLGEKARYDILGKEPIIKETKPKETKPFTLPKYTPTKETSQSLVYSKLLEQPKLTKPLKKTTVKSIVKSSTPALPTSGSFTQRTQPRTILLEEQPIFKPRQEFMQTQRQSRIVMQQPRIKQQLSKQSTVLESLELQQLRERVPSTRQLSRQPNIFSQALRQPQIQQPTQITRQAQLPAIRTRQIPRISYPTPVFTATTFTTPPIIPPSFGFMRGGGFSRPSFPGFSRQRKRYQPSLGSVILGIESFKMPRFLTGIGFRPVIKSRSYSGKRGRKKKSRR